MTDSDNSQTDAQGRSPCLSVLESVDLTKNLYASTSLLRIAPRELDLVVKVKWHGTANRDGDFDVLVEVEAVCNSATIVRGRGGGV